MARFESERPNVEIAVDAGERSYTPGGGLIVHKRAKTVKFGSLDSRNGIATLETNDKQEIDAINRSYYKWKGAIRESKGVTVHQMPNNPIARMYLCEFCDEEFEKKAELIEHRIREHERKSVGKAKMQAETKQGKPDKKMFKCGDCGEAFDSRVSVRWHRKKKHS